MIILGRQQKVFIKGHKVGGSSIEAFLKDNCWDDITFCTPIMPEEKDNMKIKGRQYYTRSERVEIFLRYLRFRNFRKCLRIIRDRKVHSHDGAIEASVLIRRRLNMKTDNFLFVFCVRNPDEQNMSKYKMFVRREIFNGSYNDFIVAHGTIDENWQRSGISPYHARFIEFSNLEDDTRRTFSLDHITRPFPKSKMSKS